MAIIVRNSITVTGWPKPAPPVWTNYKADGTLDTSVANPGITNRTKNSGMVGSGGLVRVLGSNQRKSGGTLNISPSVSWKHDNLKVDVAGMYSVGKTAYTSGQDGFFSLGAS